MAVIGLHGIPGCGKTLSATSICLKHYRKENLWIKRFFRYLTKKPIIVNNVYTNYPVCLNKRKNIFSNVVTIYDLNNSYKYLNNSIIVIDEVQAFFDSYRDFKQFPTSISTFFQFHRHFGIKDIYVISQHPRRVLTYIRDVISQYHRIKRFVKIPLIRIGIVCYKLCYEFEDYTQSFTRDKEVKKLLQIKTKFYIFRLRKTFKAFDSKYLRVFNENKPFINKGTYNSYSLPIDVVQSLESKLFYR